MNGVARCFVVGVLALVGVMAPVAGAQAQSFPSSVDSGRVKDPLAPDPVPDMPSFDKIVPTYDARSVAPRGAKDINFVLTSMTVKGMTVYPVDKFDDMFAPFIGKNIPLDKVWEFADRIQRYYHQNGYNLTQVFVPTQEIVGGKASVVVNEGFVKDLSIEGMPNPPRIIQKMIDALEARRPLRSTYMESFLMRLNDFPGHRYRAVLAGSRDEDGGIRIVMQKIKQKPSRSILIDNTGSRFTGPYQVTLGYHDTFWSLQKTSFSFITNFERDETKYGSMRHKIQVAPKWDIFFSGSQSITKPGSTLARNQLKSESISFNVGVNWKPIVQRWHNLSVALELAGKNTNGDILGDTILTRDRIRVARGYIRGAVSDKLSGYNNMSLGVYRGLNILGASDKQDPDLSRSEATPHFTVAVVDYSRQQRVTKDVTVVNQVLGQFTSDPLFSSEEFGYGGERFGRSYDGGDFNGDRGVATSVEMRYETLPLWHELVVKPYAYYDVAKVWDLDTDGIDETAASTGAGVRLSNSQGFSSNFAIAWPLTAPIAAPIYGNGKNPRLHFSLSYKF